MSSLQLLGMKHTGKSSLGRLWASKHGARFLDLDNILEGLAGGGRTSREVYRTEGAEGFRSWEAKAARQAAAELRDDACVLAWGGGTISNPEAVSILKPHGVLVVINETAERLYERILRGGRPAFLSAQTPWEDFLTLYAQRTALFRALTPHHIDAAGAPLDEVLEKLETLWNTLPETK